MLERLLLVGVALVIMIVTSTSPREKRPMAFALAIALTCFSMSAIHRSGSGWVLIEIAGAVVTGWLIRDGFGVPRRAEPDDVPAADAGISRE